MKNSKGRTELDTMIVEIELTLVSIIQGVALTVLIENAQGVISDRQFVFWPYIAAGLLVIFVFWSRAVLHIITVIRWPLEFGHNFLYIACALVEALLFAQITKPASWFGFVSSRARAVVYAVSDGLVWSAGACHRLGPAGSSGWRRAGSHRCRNRTVRADPVTAAEAISQSRLFISNHHLKGVRLAFSGVDSDRREAQSFDVGTRAF